MNTNALVCTVPGFSGHSGCDFSISRRIQPPLFGFSPIGNSHPIPLCTGTSALFLSAPLISRQFPGKTSAARRRSAAPKNRQKAAASWSRGRRPPTRHRRACTHPDRSVLFLLAAIGHADLSRRALSRRRAGAAAPDTLLPRQTRRGLVIAQAATRNPSYFIPHNAHAHMPK